MTLVSAPLAFVSISIFVVERALSTGQPLLPIAVILCAILPRHDTFTMAKAATHLALVHSTCCLISDRLLSLWLVCVKFTCTGNQGLHEPTFDEVPFVFHLLLALHHPVLSPFEKTADHGLNFNDH